MRRALLPAALAAVALSAAPAAAQTSYVPGEVIVRYEDGTSGGAATAVEAASGTASGGAALASGSETLRIKDGDTVAHTVRELRKDPSVAYAVPNFIARASAFTPNDLSLIHISEPTRRTPI